MNKKLNKVASLVMATIMVVGSLTIGTSAMAEKKVETPVADATIAPIVSEVEPTAKPNKEKKEKKDKSVIKFKAVCTGAGKINVNFTKDVEWSEEVTAVLVDGEGNETALEFIKKTAKKAIIKGVGMVKGAKYALTINGVKLKGAEEFASITYNFKAKKIKTDVKAQKVAKKVKVKKATKVVVKCKGKIQLQDATVVVVDEDNNTFEAKIVGKQKGNVKISVDGLEKGKKYTATINGIKLKKELNFGSVTTNFTTK